MKETFSILLILLLWPALGSLSAQSSSLHPEIDAVFADLDRTNSPGCALAVIKDGRIVYSRGYGMADLEHGIANRPETVFYIGSVSKQFVTMCILLLEEKGLIGLDDDVRKYFPELPDYGHTITVSNLIHHTSGIRDYLTLWSLAGNNYLDNMENEVVYDLICRQKELNFEPGTKYLYSNSCYFMMALLVEKVTGSPISDFAQKEIFGPLAMTNTLFYDDNKKLIPNRAFGYDRNSEGSFDNMMMRFDLVGSGGIYSTVEDLLRWDQNFYENVLGKGGPGIIAKMETNGKYKDGSEVDYAFALVNGRYRGLRTVSHGGALGGYRAHYVRFPDQSFSVVILGNLAQLQPSRRSYQVADIYLAESFTAPAEDQVYSAPPSAGTMNAFLPKKEALQKIKGRYYSYEIDAAYNFSIDDDHLMVEVVNGQKNRLTAKDPHTFVWQGITLRFADDYRSFELDAGRVTNLKFNRE